jgi:hypothetical protein
MRKAGEPGPGVGQPDPTDRAALTATRAQQIMGIWMNEKHLERGR